MKILLKSATIIDSTSEHHLSKKDILINNGVIESIADSINVKTNKTVSLENLHVSMGWFDSSISFGEPGYEDRETIDNGLEVAAKSGFTHIALNPTSKPIVQSQASIQYLRSRAKEHAVSLHPVGAMSIDAKGEDLTELYDMHCEGAIAFYDYQKPIENANLLKLALQYTQSFNGLIQSFPMDKSIAAKAVVNEGVTSTMLGLKGMPSLSETLQIARDIAILKYTGGRLHIPTISTAESVEMIKQAKASGLQISCSVNITHLLLTDSVLDSFDTRYKILPPIRLAEDRQALLDGLANGTIDGVTCDHRPLTIEEKKVEFEQALYGSIGMESAFPALNKLVGTERAVTYLNGLKKVFGIPEQTIKEGSVANLSLFQPDGEWSFEKEHILSSQTNSSLLGQPMKGNVYGIIANNQLSLRDFVK